MMRPNQIHAVRRDRDLRALARISISCATTYEPFVAAGVVFTAAVMLLLPPSAGRPW